MWRFTGGVRERGGWVQGGMNWNDTAPAGEYRAVAGVDGVRGGWSQARKRRVQWGV